MWPAKANKRRRWEIPLDAVFLDGQTLPATTLTGTSTELSALIDTVFVAVPLNVSMADLAAGTRATLSFVVLRMLSTTSSAPSLQALLRIQLHPRPSRAQLLTRCLSGSEAKISQSIRVTSCRQTRKTMLRHALLTTSS